MDVFASETKKKETAIINMGGDKHMSKNGSGMEGEGRTEMINVALMEVRCDVDVIDVGLEW